MDGDKFICLDNIIQTRNCIIYSFGIANDWTFEDQMESFGKMNQLSPSLDNGKILLEDVKYTLTTLQ